MATTKRLRKRRKAVHRLDLTPLKEALKDRRCWTCLAVTAVPDGLESHFELLLDEETGELVDILVDVITQPDEQELTCRLGGMSSRGVLTIPALGDEVLVAVPAGRIDFMPTITAILSSRDLPNPAGQGPDAARTLIVNSEVLIHDGSGGAKELAYKEDLDNHKAHFDAHTHHQWGFPTGAVDAGTAWSTSPPSTPAGAPPTGGSAPGGVPAPAPTPVGTSVLKGK